MKKYQNIYLKIDILKRVFYNTLVFLQYVNVFTIRSYSNGNIQKKYVYKGGNNVENDGTIRAKL